MRAGELVEVAVLDPDLSGLLRGSESLLELRERGRHREAQLLELRLVVVDADELALRGVPEEASGSELLAVGGPGADGRDVLRHAVEPAVRVGVVIERKEQPRLHHLAHVRPTLVRLHDVRSVRARDRELQHRLEIAEAPVHAVDRDVRVLLLERLVQLVPDRLDLAGLLVPDGERDGLLDRHSGVGGLRRRLRGTAGASRRARRRGGERCARAEGEELPA